MPFILRPVSDSSDSDSSRSEDMSDEYDSEEKMKWAPTSNSAVYDELWPIQDRPKRYRKAETFDALPEATICNMINIFTNLQKKRKSADGEAFGKTKKLKLKKFKVRFCILFFDLFRTQKVALTLTRQFVQTIY